MEIYFWSFKKQFLVTNELLKNETSDGGKFSGFCIFLNKSIWTLIMTGVNEFRKASLVTCIYNTDDVQGFCFAIAETKA